MIRFLVFFLLCPFAWAGTYDAEFVEAYDADSVTLKISLWPDMEYQGNMRVFGIDTPELAWRADCESERIAAEYAKSYTVGILSAAKSIRVTVDKLDKFGRPLAIIVADGEDLRESLVNAGYARRYDGGSRAGWCDR